jgi:DNA-binding transcriptional ArsR family regulator
MFRALCHPARMRIVRLLAQRESCICGELVDELPLAQATVSQHLKVLKDAGIITGQVKGPAVCYCLAPGALASLHEAVARLAADADDPSPKGDSGSASAGAAVRSPNKTSQCCASS